MSSLSKKLLPTSVRRQLANFAADERGIALQTVIIMVVLIAIAGAIAAVLVTRGNQAVTEIERTNIAAQPTNFSSKTLCEAAGFYWAGSACQTSAPPPSPPPPSAPADFTAQGQTACGSVNHKWDPATSTCKKNPDPTAYNGAGNERYCTGAGYAWDAGTNACS